MKTSDENRPWRRTRANLIAKLRNLGYRQVRHIERTVHLRPITRPFRQITVRGLGHEEPTLFLTNDADRRPAALVERYAHRRLIENSIGENVDFFHLDALCSAIAIRVDFDVMLTLIAGAPCRRLARRLVGFEAAKPKQIFRHFLNTPARVRVTDTEVHVRIRRWAHHPILLGSEALDARPAVPWWPGRRLHLEVRGWA